MVKEYSHMVKKLKANNGPKDLYEKPYIWMEGMDLEGFNGHFSYGFIKEPGVCHPLEGSLVHPYDECLVFAGLDTENIRYLGAEVSIELGEEHEEHVFSEPTVVVIPRGTRHGPVTTRNIEKPFVHYCIGLSPEYKASVISEDQKPPKTTGQKHRHLIKKLITYIDPDAVGSGMGYERITDSEGIMHPAENGIGPANADQLVWLFGKDLEGLEVNFTWGFYSRCGKWHREGEAHTHPEEEILVFVGFNPDDINELGAELEVAMGSNDERHFFNKPTVAICPAGFPHLPLITRWVDKPYGFFVICLNAEHESPWVEEDK